MSDNPTPVSDSTPASDALDTLASASPAPDTSAPADAAAPDATTPETPPAIGDEHEFDIDGEKVTLADLKEARAHIQQSVKALKEARKLEASARSLFDGLKSDPKRTFLDIFTALSGNDRKTGYAALVDFASEILDDAVKIEQAPPEQREALRWKEEAAAARAELEAIQRQRDEDAASAERARHVADWHRSISTALAAESLPTDDDTISEVANILVRAREAGFNPTAQKAAQHLKKQRASRPAIPPDIDPASLPEELIKKINQFSLARVKQSGNNGAPTSSAPAESSDVIRLPSRARV